MKEFAVFWGCTIPARFPFIEKSTRVMFDDLGAQRPRARGSHVLPRGHARQGERPGRVLHRRRAQPRARREGRPRRRDAVQRLLLDVQGGAEPPRRRTGASATTINERLATEDLHYDGDLQVVHFAEWLADDMGAGAHRQQGEEAASGACTSPSTTAATCCARSRRCAGTTRCIPRRSRRSSPPSARASSTTRPRCSAAAARSTAWASATARSRSPPQALRPADQRGRRARRRLPELLPAVRPEPGRAAARQRGHQRPGALPLRAHRARPTATRPRRSAWTCTA